MLCNSVVFTSFLIDLVQNLVIFAFVKAYTDFATKPYYFFIISLLCKLL